MRMIHKMYTCEIPSKYDGGHYSNEYKVSAWMAPGSDTVNIRCWDPLFGWAQDYPEIGVTGVIQEKLSRYVAAGIRTMDDLIGYLFYVKA